MAGLAFRSAFGTGPVWDAKRRQMSQDDERIGIERMGMTGRRKANVARAGLLGEQAKFYDRNTGALARMQNATAADQEFKTGYASGMPSKEEVELTLRRGLGDLWGPENDLFGSGTSPSIMDLFRSLR